MLCGCNQSPYDVAPARGTVSIADRPVVAGKIMFRPLAKQGELEAGKPALGRIQSDGTFVLRTFADDDGAIVGEHSITVVDPQFEQPASASATKLPAVRRVAVPGNVTVVAGTDNEFNVRISAEQLARFGTR